MKILATLVFAALVAPQAMAESAFDVGALAAASPEARAPQPSAEDACRFSIAYESDTVKVWVCLVPNRREDGKN